MSEETYKLIYFDIEGLGELIRLLFAAKGVKYEDVRINRADWPNLAPSMPFGQMPVLEINGQQLAQSNAISRYLATKFGLAGSSPLERAQVDSWADQVEDFGSLWQHVFYASRATDMDPEELQRLVAAAKEKTPACLGYFEKRLSQHDYLVGNEMTWADLKLTTRVQYFWKQAEYSKDIFDETPKIIEHYQRVRELPGIKEWISSRP